MAYGPVTSWQIDGAKLGAVADFIFLASKITADGERFYFLGLQKSLQMVTAAIKLKDACSLEEKL